MTPKEYPVPVDIRNRLRAAPGGGRGGGPGGRGGGLNYVVGPPTVERPPLAIDFNQQGTLTARTSGNTPAQFVDADFQVPPNNVAVLRSISILENALLIDSDIIWTLRFNARNVPGWDALTMSARAAGSLEVSWPPEETFIAVPEGVQIAFTTTVRDGGTYQLSVQFHGWFYPASVQPAADLAYGG